MGEFLSAWKNTNANGSMEGYVANTSTFYSNARAIILMLEWSYV